MNGPLVFALPPSKGLGRATGLTLSPYELRRFDDGELKSRPLVSVRGADVYILCSVHGNGTESVNDRLCRLLFFAGAIRDAGADRITIVAPYLCYARKDRRTNPRDPVTTRYVARMIESAGADRVVTLDVHNRAAFENAFRIPTEHLEANPLFAKRCRTLGQRLAIVSPDPGGFHRAEALRDILEAGGAAVELAVMGKHRKADVVRSEAFVGNVDGRVAVIVDDMIVTGTTLARCAEACRLHGATAVHAMVSHGMFGVGARSVLSTSQLDSITITDSVALDRVIDLTNVSVLSIAHLLARTITLLHEDRPITPVITAHEARAR
jgi:ribose-phosphate pyrophosphokinase